MNTDQEQSVVRFGGKHHAITETILRVFFDVFNELGGGFLESVYHAAFELALKQSGLRVVSQVAIPVYFRGSVVGDFRADLIVNEVVLLELKAVSVLDRSHEAQVMNDLRATSLEVGMLFNFGPKPQFKRFVMDNQQKKIRVHPCESVVEPLGGAK